MPLNKNEDADINVSTRSALAELTPLEYEKDLPNGQMERCQTQHLASLCSARMGGWRTATTTYGGPQDSTE